MFSNAKSLRKNTDVDRIIIILGTAQRGGRDELQKKKNAVLQKGNAHESLLPTSFSLWFIIFHYTPYVYLIKNNGKPWVDSFSAVWAARKPSKGAFFAELHPLRLGCVAAAEKHAKLRKTAAAQISGANMHTPWLPLRPPPLVGWAGAQTHHTPRWDDAYFYSWMRATIVPNLSPGAADTAENGSNWVSHCFS